MTIEITILISIISVSTAIFMGIKNNKRADNAGVEKQTANMTSITVKLENIISGMAEIKSEVTGIKRDYKEVIERVIVVEQIAKSAQKRIDSINEKVWE